MIVRGAPMDEEPGIGETTIPGYLREVTTQFAGREALVMHAPGGVLRWTYQNLWDKSVEVARALIASGLGKEQRVGILMTNRPEFLTAFYGTAIAGGVAVVFSTFSTALELSQLLALSQISLLLFEGLVLKTDFGAMLAELEPAMAATARGQLQSERFPFLRHVVRLGPADDSASARDHAGYQDWDDFLGRGAGLADAVVSARLRTITPADAGGLFFSSGTTSLPKGILHAQRAFALQWWRYPRLAGIDVAVRCLTTNGLFWSGNIGMSIGLTFTRGGTLILQPHFDAAAALQLIELERVSFLYGRPHQWARLQEAATWATADLRSLRYITRGEVLWTHPTVSTDWCIPMGYGNTETLSICTSIAFNTSRVATSGDYGTPLPGNTLKIVDPDSGAVLPVGNSGEICIKGPTLMIAYLGKTPEETFDDEGYFRTGDGGHVDTEGRLYWEGRITDIIKTGGANVSPVEIDEALALYPGVRRAQTVGLPHETLGEMIVSCIVANDGVTLDRAAITAFLKERIASFKVPRKILFFRDDELDVTGSGKVKLARLREIARARL
jgi:fatty-acyl-CoA synthase